ncbi:LpqB family beta-propeller domain-containing protein [Buchananella felis]|uniref:LpqB family beta-propeller domain-containing protein n=1 Tax=Buchananella felis TaxID=3231492 RepID=UPI0035299FF5
MRRGGEFVGAAGGASSVKRGVRAHVPPALVSRGGGRAGVVAVVVAAALSLSACTAYPQSGPVQAANPDLPDLAQVAQTASGPIKDASPTEILSGFLRASAAGLDDDFGTARRFLTPEVAGSWDPGAGVLIYPSDAGLSIERSQTEAGGQVVKLATAVTGTLSRHGQFNATDPDARTSLSFEMSKDAAGQWRISHLEDGVLLSSASFSLAYTARTLAFLTPDRRAAVADLRYLPLRRLPTHVMNALVVGPAPWLEGAVASAIPAGAQLTGGGVELKNGVAEVDLATETLLTPQERSQLRAQVEASLAGIPQVQTVQIILNGEEVDNAAAALETRTTTNPLLVSSENSLRHRIGEEWEQVPAPEGAVSAPRHPTYLGASIVYTDGGQLRILEEREARVLAEDFRAAPSVDRLGWIWGERRGEGLSVINAAGKTRTVIAPWLAGAQVLQVLISRDGARLVTVRKQGSAVRVEAMGVARDAEGAPTALGEPAFVAEVDGEFFQLAWENDVQLLALHGREGVSVLDRIQLGGLRSSQRVQDGAVQLAVNPSDRAIVVVTKNGELLQYQGGVWRLSTTGVMDPSFGN